MAEQAVVHIGENSPEEVAYKLLQDIMDSEQRTKHPKLKEKTLADRKWLLVDRFRHLHPLDITLRANVGIKGTTSKSMILVELLNLTFASTPDVTRDANVKFAPLDTYAECLNATKGHRPFK
ncbi:MAG: hypothetical protein IOC90_13515 [Methylocystis sp.]|nr:hypothetical protein [Methylocystis sp.]MCA3584589.1 hypothetical protein [Methylocystis sp.]MCA3589031.1 hypothetical protein [Methylocystis sp.]